MVWGWPIDGLVGCTWRARERGGGAAPGTRLPGLQRGITDSLRTSGGIWLGRWARKTVWEADARPIRKPPPGHHRRRTGILFLPWSPHPSLPKDAERSPPTSWGGPAGARPAS